MFCALKINVALEKNMKKAPALSPRFKTMHYCAEQKYGACHDHVQLMFKLEFEAFLKANLKVHYHDTKPIQVHCDRNRQQNHGEFALQWILNLNSCFQTMDFKISDIQRTCF